MANSYYYSNLSAETTLSGSVSSGATSIQVAAVTGFPTSYPYILAVDYGASAEELVSVTAAASTTLTVTRGFGGTSAQSHSLGAVVRHVVNAQDLTDFRTHEAATGAVHGLTGDIVGTSDTQTLANKTLTAPTVNAGALSSTFTGDPTLSGNVTFSGTLTGAGALAGTFSGSPVFSGTPDFTGAIQSTQSLATNTSLASIVTADTFDRYRLYADGKHEWGSGSAARDTNLYRSAADELTTDDALVVTGELHPNNLVRNTRTASTDSAYETRVSADSFARWFVRASGETWWGAGTAVVDTNLYRSAANTLKTDDALVVGGTLSDSATTIRYRPAVTGSASITFASATSNTTAVSFGSTFASAPNIALTINSGAGTTIGWMCRALNVTTIGFDLNVSTNGSAQAWSAVPVMWTATAQ